MVSPNLFESFDYNPISTPQIEPTLDVDLTAGRQMKDLTTRADKLSESSSLVKYDFKSLLQEFEYLQRTISVKLSDQDKQALANLATSSNAPSAADVKLLAEITERFTKENPVLPASDSAWFKASLERLNRQQAIVAELNSQSPEFRKTEALNIRNTAIDELRADLPADKVAEIDKAFPDKTSKEAVQKLLELAETRKKELDASYHADDKKTLARINISLAAISKCETEIAECLRLAPPPVTVVTPPPAVVVTPSLTPQEERKLHEQNYYQDNLAKELGSFASLVAKADFDKIEQGTYANQGEKISALLKAIRDTMNLSTNAEWKVAALRENPQLAKFFDDRSEKLQITPEALNALTRFADRPSKPDDGVSTIADRQTLITIARDLNRFAEEKAQWEKDFPNGTPDPAIARAAQAERKQHEQNYYQDNLAKELGSFASLVAKADFDKIEQGTYANQGEKISALLKAIRDTMNLSTNAEWKVAALRENPQLAKFFDDRSEKLEITPEALNALTRFADRPNKPDDGVSTIAERQTLITIARDLNRFAEEKAQWEKDFPNGRP